MSEVIFEFNWIDGFSTYQMMGIRSYDIDCYLVFD